MIRAVFFDVDCTLYSHEKNTILTSTVQAIQALKKKKVYVFLATGRHQLELDQIDFQGLTFDGFITLSGQLCLNHNFDVIYENSIHEEDVKILREEFQKKETSMSFVEQNDMYMNFYSEKTILAHNKINLNKPHLHDLTQNKLYQVTLYDDEETVYRISKLLSHSKCTGWNEYGTDIIPVKGGKSSGIQAMMKYFNLKQDELMAIGDAENDIDMIQFAKIGVAMGNGNEKLKKAADYVTDDVNQDGIYNALVHYDLI